MVSFMRDAEVQLNLAEITEKEVEVLGELEKRPYHWINIKAKRSRMARQRLVDRGFIEARGILGIDRQHRLTPKGREYLGIAEVDYQK